MSSHEDVLQGFLRRHQDSTRPIVCITSGGTIVPLEHNMVRFLDNFSQGERGAMSAEFFLSLGYVVIFLYRTGSKLPLCRVLKEVVSKDLDLHFMQQLHVADQDGNISIKIGSSGAKSLIGEEVKLAKAVQEQELLLTLPFTSIYEYLTLLENASVRLAPFGPRVCMYLAAAVSDFYIPKEQMATHKIQSDSSLSLDLQQVPKKLGVLTSNWCPNAYIVSFKLETDKAILIQKATRAIDRYQVHVVVANLLHERRDQCILVERPVKDADVVEEVISRPKQLDNIEAVLIPALVSKHMHFIQSKYKASLHAGGLNLPEHIVDEVMTELSTHQLHSFSKQMSTYLQHRNDFLPAWQLSHNSKNHKEAAEEGFSWKAHLRNLTVGVGLLAGISVAMHWTQKR